MVRGAHGCWAARVTPLPPLWEAERDEALTCVAMRAETHDVSTFVFAPVTPRLFRFLPGQFMTFELDGAGVQRSYTIASPPTRPWRIEVTAKRTPGGPGSGWLHDAMRPGVQVRAMGPMGDFTLEPGTGGKYLFLSAGSGITPVMSMARTLHDLGSDADVLFLHSARSPADILFAEELAAMSRRPGFRSVGIVECDTDGARWDGLRGRLSPAMLGLLAPDLLDREVFCCGPAPYMEAVRAMLDAAGFDRARYREESFSFGGAAPDQPSSREKNGHLKPGPVGGIPQAVQTDGVLVQDESGLASFTIRFARLGREIVCPPGVSVLAAARSAGVRLPAACGKGVCGTCKSRLVSGTVEMRHGGGIRQREIDDGLALLCCARPTSDLVVDR